MVEAEGEIEGRIAVPGTFRVQQYWTLRRHQYVFRAEIAMHQRELGACGGCCDFVQPRGTVRMARRRGEQIGLQPDRLKNVIVGEALRDLADTPCRRGWRR